MDGVSVGEGLMNHMTAHCIGLGEPLNQMRRSSGRCTVTDIDGDQIAVDLAVDWYPNGAKDYPANVTFTAGTGKYEGITGGLKEICYNGAFRAAPPTTRSSPIAPVREATNCRRGSFVHGIQGLQVHPFPPPLVPDARLFVVRYRHVPKPQRGVGHASFSDCRRYPHRYWGHCR